MSFNSYGSTLFVGNGNIPEIFSGSPNPTHFATVVWDPLDMLVYDYVRFTSSTQKAGYVKHWASNIFSEDKTNVISANTTWWSVALNGSGLYDCLWQSQLGLFLSWPANIYLWPLSQFREEGWSGPIGPGVVL